ARNAHLAHRAVGIGVEAAVVDAPDHHAGALDRCAHLEAGDVVELSAHDIGAGQVHAGDIHHAQREKEQRPDADENEDPDPQVERGTAHDVPRNMNEVSTKSSARMASAELTTVRVIAREMPSAVGWQS